MLRAVGHPVAVNPDAELLRVAREEGWEVMRFDRLRRRLQVGVAALALTGVAAGGGALLSARARRPRRRFPVLRG
jgi:phosphoserine phosphatase